MSAFLVRSADGKPSRIVRVPEGGTADAQLAAGETAEPYVADNTVSFMPPPDVVVIDEASLLAQIDRERETEQMRVLTNGGAKKYVYNRKTDEVRDSRTLTTSLLNALSLTDKERRFPFAQAEAAQTGETLAAVLARFAVGMDGATSKLAAIEAKAQRAKRAVIAAKTIGAKQQAATVDWSK